MMNNHNTIFLYFMMFFLGAFYFVSYFMPEHYGMKCTPDHGPLGSYVLLFFYMIWTVFVTYVIRNDPLIVEHNRSKTWSASMENTKELMLKTYKGKYDYHKMLLA